jgi:hypothetical protein
MPSVGSGLQWAGKRANGSLSVLNVPSPAKAGSPTRRESHGDGAPIVVRERESRSQGEGAGYESIRELHPDNV